jgi:hypothetical protein
VRTARYDLAARQIFQESFLETPPPGERRADDITWWLFLRRPGNLAALDQRLVKFREAHSYLRIDERKHSPE